MMPKLMDNIPRPIKAHDVRKLTRCRHCGGLGHREYMVLGKHHTRCYKLANGFAAVLALPHEERTKYRLKDLTAREFSKLLDSTDELTTD